MKKEFFSSFLKDPDFERLSLQLKKPNIFKITKVQNYEIRHSNFLSWLLNPLEGHGLGTTFLKWFLRDIFSDKKIEWADEFTVDDLELLNIKVIREWNNIDILLESKKFVICIENKFHSKEHSRQLSKYKLILEKYFPSKNLGYVFLTPEGILPEDSEDEEVYAVASYRSILENLSNIIEIYDQSIPQKAKIYMEDYLEIVKEGIMKESEEIELAQKLYQNHKEVIDFIFENKPDRLLDVSPIFESVITELGYRLCSPNKGYCRFLTKRLYEIIPKTGHGWKKNEQFAFEIDYWPKKITLKTVIAPGNEENRKLISALMSEIENTTKPIGKQWLVHWKITKRLDVTSEEYEDDGELKVLLKKFLEDGRTMIELVESKLLKNKSKFIQN